ncbi:virulence factor, partial [Burkholderia sp. 22313]
MKRFFVVPGLAAFMVFLFTTAIMRSAQATSASEHTENATSAVEKPAMPFAAQVVGLMWLNPLQRMDYPTEWQLLWTQRLAAPNKNDDMVRTDPKSFTTLQSVAGIAYGNEGEETFRGFYRKYMFDFPLLLSS